MERVLYVEAGARGQGSGVRFRQLHYRWSRVALIDVDLDCPGVRVEVVAEDASRRTSGCSDGTARTVADWLRMTGGLAGINGGFFGRDTGRGRKEIVGLLKMDGEQYARAPRYWDRVETRADCGLRIVGFGLSDSPHPQTTIRDPQSKKAIPYAHSALGFDAGRRPAIDWVISDRRRPTRLLAFDQAELLSEHPFSVRSWNVRSALSGGPRLIADGQLAVSDRAERLMSQGLLPRTFVGYALDPRRGAPRHLVLGAATAMTFHDAARFLDRYFRRFHGVACAEAMALDGGPSSQLAYRADGAIYEAQTSDVTVPTCVIVHGDPTLKGGPVGTLTPAHSPK